MTAPALFPATQWSLVLSARANGAQGREALEALLRAYWPPLFAYLRSDGHPPDVAQDLLQGYLTRLLARNDLNQVAPENGRFRSYLLAGLRNHLVSELRRERAAKRGAGTVVSLESDEAARHLAAAPAPGLSPEAAFDRQWACTMLARALRRLEHEHHEQGRSRLFEILRPTLTGDGDEDHATLAARLDLTPGAVAVAVHRLRRRLRDLVRFEVSQTVGTRTDLEAEMRHLLAVWD